MTKTKRMTAARGTTKKATRRPAKTRRAPAAGFALHVSPSTRRKIRANLPIAVAIVVGGAAISTTIAMRQQLAGALRMIGDASASGWKSVAGAVPMDRWLVRSGLRRRPLWARTLPVLGVVGGLMAGAAAFFFAPRGRSASPVLPDPTEEGVNSTPVGSPSLSNSFAEHEASAHGHG
jgi:hypothetical protein